MLFSSLAILVCYLRSALSFDTVVDLGYARYLGTLEDGVNKWRGIRFAAAPLGERRFRAPDLPGPYDGIQNATKFQPGCIGVGDNTTNPTVAEDCLFLNIYTPSSATTESKLPVYVFIQGGGFATNSNRDYDGTGLIRASGDNMVVVNFNYRVGIYGFLASQEVVEDGDTNVGILDQRAVLEWVQEHVTKFGGDPDHVVLGGASSGAGSVTLHQTAYGGRDDGLFHAVAAESQSFPTQLRVSEAQYQYDNVLANTGCDSLACLRNLSTALIQEAQDPIPFPFDGTSAPPIFMWSAVIDGGLIPDYTYALYRTGRFIDVPSIFGDDTNEGTVFAPSDETANYEEVNQFLVNNFPRLTQTNLEKIDDLYPRGLQFPDRDEYWRTAAAAYGEVRYICPGLYVSNVVAGGTAGGYPAYPNASDSGSSEPDYPEDDGEGYDYPDDGGDDDYPTGSHSWNYRYNVMDPNLYSSGLGTTHTEEIGAVWGPEYIGGTAPASYNSTNAGIVPVVQGYWTSFITTFDPNTHRAPDTPVWRPFVPGRFNRIRLNTTGTVMERAGPKQISRCRFWWEIAEDVGQY